MREIIDYLNEYLSTQLCSETIGYIRRNSGNYKTGVLQHNFDDLTIAQFLALYKINKLKEYDVITEDTANNLCKIQSLLIFTEREIGEEISKEIIFENKSEKLFELHKRHAKLKNILKKYHLDFDEIYISQFIDTDILREVYPPKNSDETYRLVKMYNN